MSKQTNRRPTITSIFTSQRRKDVSAAPLFLEEQQDTPRYATPVPETTMDIGEDDFAPEVPADVTADPLPVQDQERRNREAQERRDEEDRQRSLALRRERQVASFRTLIEPVHLYARQVLGLMSRNTSGEGLWRLNPFTSWKNAYELCLEAGEVKEEDMELLDAQTQLHRDDESIRLGKFFMENHLFAMFENICCRLQLQCRIHVAQLLRNGTTRAKMAEWTIALLPQVRVQYARDRSVNESRMANYKQIAFANFFQSLSIVTENRVLMRA